MRLLPECQRPVTDRETRRVLILHPKVPELIALLRSFCHVALSDAPHRGAKCLPPIEGATRKRPFSTNSLKDFQNFFRALVFDDCENHQGAQADDLALRARRPWARGLALKRVSKRNGDEPCYTSIKVFMCPRHSSRYEQLAAAVAQVTAPRTIRGLGHITFASGQSSKVPNCLNCSYESQSSISFKCLHHACCDLYLDRLHAFSECC